VAIPDRADFGYKRVQIVNRESALE